MNEQIDVKQRVEQKRSGKDQHSGHGDFSEKQAELLEHDPEKWIPVFGKDHAQTTG
jgi:hypothetical protein